MADTTIKVELCMGSSCFARGNSSVLSAIENYINENVHGKMQVFYYCFHFCIYH